MRKSYDKRELAVGINVELEHTDDLRVAERIAKDHLDEDPKYYSHLAECGMLHNPSFIPNFRYGDLGKPKLRWFHGTGRDHGEQILKDGFIRPRKSDDFKKYSGPDDPLLPIPGRVYVTTATNQAAKYAMDGTMFESWKAYDKVYCYVFEVEIDDDADVLVDEDLIAEKEDRLLRVGGFKKSPHYSVEDDDIELAKHAVTHAKDDDLIRETLAILESDGFVNLAVKGDVRVINAWRIPSDAFIRRTSRSGSNMTGWEQIELAAMTPNGWNEYIRGEYWYYEDQLYDADSSTGKGHEQVAQDLILDIDQMRSVAERWYAAKGVPLPDWLDDDTEPSEALHRLFHGRKPLLLSEHEWEQAWTEALGKKWFDLWRTVETRGRFLQGEEEQSFSVELLKRGAIRILDGYVEVWKLDKKTLITAQDALWEIMQVWAENPAGRIALEEVHPQRKSVEIDLAEFLDAKSPKQVWDALAYAKNSSGYYVWVVDHDMMPFENEGPYGPFERAKAMAFARIGAQTGVRTRVVSRGVNPESKSFEVIEVFRSS